MTAEQKKQIISFRSIGTSYGKIADFLDIPINTVKSFCRRNNLGGRIAEDTDNSICEFCGQSVKQNAHRKKKRFCSDACRMKWWRKNHRLNKGKSITAIICGHCGRKFFDYEKAHRKYCSHKCYIDERFGGEINE